MAIVSAHETMRGVVFDLPPVADICENSSVNTTPGTVYRQWPEITPPTPSAMPMIWSFPPEPSILPKVICLKLSEKYDALNPGGVFISLHTEASHERTKPGDHVCDFLLNELSGMDMIFPKAWLRNNDGMRFQIVRSLPIDCDFGPLDIEIGKK